MADWKVERDRKLAQLESNLNKSKNSTFTLDGRVYRSSYTSKNVFDVAYVDYKVNGAKDTYLVSRSRDSVNDQEETLLVVLTDFETLMSSYDTLITSVLNKYNSAKSSLEAATSLTDIEAVSVTLV